MRYMVRHRVPRSVRRRSGMGRRERRISRKPMPPYVRALRRRRDESMKKTKGRDEEAASKTADSARPCFGDEETQ